MATCAILISMSRMYKLLPARVMFVNYIGGIGYYCLHFAWILTLFLLSFSVLQYVVLNGEFVMYNTGPAGGQIVAPNGTSTHLLGLLVSAASFLAVVIFLTLLPYWLGYISRGIPRWILKQTSWKPTLQHLHLTKQACVAVVFFAALISLYSPQSAPLTNVPFLITLGACVISSLSFVVQYKMAAFMKLHERSVY